MLDKIRLNNFKCYGKEIVAPFSMFNVLYGKNGRGKSSLIQSVLLLSQTLKDYGNVDYLHLIGDYANLGGFDDVINRNSQGEKKSFFIDVVAENEDMRMEFLRDENKPTLAKLVNIKNGNNPLMSEMVQRGSTAISEEVNYGSPTQSALLSFTYLKRLRFISANRPGPKNYENRNDEKDEPILFPNANNLFNVLASLSKPMQKEVENGLSYVLSGASLKIKPGKDTIELFLDSIDGSKGFKPMNVGYGYSYVLPIILQIITIPENSLLVIENPEAHLYPGAQSRLVELMVRYAQKKKLQFILETHSDHIINGLRISVRKKNINRKDVSILFFDRKNGDDFTPEITQIKVDSNGTLSDNPEDFMDEWTKQIFELL